MKIVINPASEIMSYANLQNVINKLLASNIKFVLIENNKKYFNLDLEPNLELDKNFNFLNIFDKQQAGMMIICYGDGCFKSFIFVPDNLSWSKASDLVKINNIINTQLGIIIKQKFILNNSGEFALKLNDDIVRLNIVLDNPSINIRGHNFSNSDLLARWLSILNTIGASSGDGVVAISSKLNALLSGMHCPCGVCNVRDAYEQLMSALRQGDLINIKKQLNLFVDRILNNKETYNRLRSQYCSEMRVSSCEIENLSKEDVNSVNLYNRKLNALFDVFRGFQGEGLDRKNSKKILQLFQKKANLGSRVDTLKNKYSRDAARILFDAKQERWSKKALEQTLRGASFDLIRVQQQLDHCNKVIRKLDEYGIDSLLVIKPNYELKPKKILTESKADLIKNKSKVSSKTLAFNVFDRYKSNSSSIGLTPFITTSGDMTFAAALQPGGRVSGEAMVGSGINVYEYERGFFQGSVTTLQTQAHVKRKVAVSKEGFSSSTELTVAAIGVNIDFNVEPEICFADNCFYCDVHGQIHLGKVQVGMEIGEFNGVPMFRPKSVLPKAIDFETERYCSIRPKKR